MSLQGSHTPFHFCVVQCPGWGLRDQVRVATFFVKGQKINIAGFVGADTVCALVRSRMLHCDYEGRKSSAGNLAFPFSPSDIHVGAVYEFSVFHLAKVDSLLETANIEIEEVRA